jgi:hypothetical protein
MNGAASHCVHNAGMHHPTNAGTGADGAVVFSVTRADVVAFAASFFSALVFGTTFFGGLAFVAVHPSVAVTQVIALIAALHVPRYGVV